MNQTDSDILHTSFFSLSWLSKSVRLPYRTDNLMGIAFFLVLFVPLIFAQGLGDNVELPKLVLLACGLATAVVISIKPVTVLRYQRGWFILFGLFVSLSILSTVFSLDPSISIIGVYMRWTSSLIFYVLWVATVILFGNAMKDRSRIMFLLRTAVFTALAMAVFGIVQTFGFAFYSGLEITARQLVPSFLGNPNFAAMYVATLFPLMLWLISIARTAPARLYYLFAAGSSIVALAFFNSRGAILGAVVGCLFVALAALISRDRRNLKRLIMILVLGIVTLVGSSILFFSVTRPDTFQSTSTLSGGDVADRRTVWHYSLNFIADNPVLGVGPGNFFLDFEKKVNFSTTGGETFDDPHNVFLYLAVVGGLPFLIVFVLIIVYALWTGWCHWRISHDQLYIVLIGATGAWLVSASFNPVVIPCWLVLALLLTALMHPRFSDHTLVVRHSVILAVRVIGILVIMAVLGLIVSDYFGVRVANEYGAKNYHATERDARLSYIFNPLNNGPMRYWASSQIALGKPVKQTRELIEWYHSLHPKVARISWYTSILYYRLFQKTADPADIARAYQYSYQAIAERPYSGSLYFHSAWLHFEQGDYAAAQTYINKSVAINTESLSSWALRAQIALALKDRSAVIDSLTHALKLQPNSAAFKYILENVKSQPDLQKITLPIQYQEPDV